MHRLRLLLGIVVLIAAAGGTALARSGEAESQPAIIFVPLPAAAGSDAAVTILIPRPTAAKITSADLAVAERECTMLTTGGVTVVPEQISEQELAEILLASAKAAADRAASFENDDENYKDWVKHKVAGALRSTAMNIGRPVKAVFAFVGLIALSEIDRDTRAKAHGQFKQMRAAVAESCRKTITETLENLESVIILNVPR